MRTRIASLLAGHQRETYLPALQKIEAHFSKHLPDVVHTTIVVDNSKPRASFEMLGEHTMLIGGDDSYREFSAWDRGLAQLDRMRETVDLIHFTTSAFDSLYTDYIRLFDDALVSSLLGSGAACGHIDHYNDPVQLLGRESQHWLRTSFVFMPTAAVHALRSMISYQQPELLFSGDHTQPFRDDAPVSLRMREYVTAWLTGNGTGQNVQWHSRFDLSQETLALFEQKTLAIVNEHMLTVRLCELGYNVVDTTWLAAELDSGRMARDIEWDRSWTDQLAGRSIALERKQEAMDSSADPEHPYDTGEAIVDVANQDQIHGWGLFSEGLTEVAIHINDRLIASVTPDEERTDLAERFRDLPSGGRAAFTYDLQPGDLDSAPGPRAAVRVDFLSRTGRMLGREVFDLPTMTLPLRSAGDNAFSPEPGESRGRSPFPPAILHLLQTLRPDGVYGVTADRPNDDASSHWTIDLMQEAVDDLSFLFHRASRQTRALFGYAAFVSETWQRIEFNARHFPQRNPTAGPHTSVARKDRKGVGTSPIEHFVIAHHLATLRSHGVPGNFCEFGCFKGFSTACLSDACFRLGLTMDVFDSFEGLPASKSDYYEKGDFAGSIDEVTRNVDEFGKLAAVRFHPGFFVDSLPTYLEPEIACLWMDVDLAVSAEDAMTVLPRLSPLGCVFSDECPEHRFDADGPVLKRGPDEVVPPIVEAFARAGRRLRGEYVAGNSGVFYDPDTAVPILRAAPLLRLRDLLMRS
jgi:hypothetical protein